jgi:hypothetical protein
MKIRCHFNTLPLLALLGAATSRPRFARLASFR